MDRRTAYGLTIESEIALPELPATSSESGRVDVVIRFAPVQSGSLRRLDGGLQWSADGLDLVYEWEGFGRIRVVAGSTILIDPAHRDDDPRPTRLMVLGPGMNTIVRQRGMVMLHASGVEIGGGCCVFVGASGMGKSTLATLLEKKGHPIVADDGIVIDGARVMPSWPSMKLWPESLHVLNRTGDPLMEGAAKQTVRAHLFQTHPLPLRAIYLLADGDVFGVEEVVGSRGALELVANASRAVPLEIVDPAGHLAACAAIARAAPVLRLTRPRNLNLLDDLAALVLRDVTTRRPNA